MPDELKVVLTKFSTKNKFKTKGPLCVALVVTQHAKKLGLPIDSKTLISSRSEGQVLGLGKSAVQAVLKRHGIIRLLASEGGRTSRGSIKNMHVYVDFLNQLNDRGSVDLEKIEDYWVSRVNDFFSGKPFQIKLDTSQTLRETMRNLISQAEKRQKDAPGTQYAGAMIQHLVGAKLDSILSIGEIKHNSFTTADAPTGRNGDFFIGDVAIHITTSPGEAVLNRCHENINNGFRPLIVTIHRSLAAAEAIAENMGLAERIEIFEIEQFISSNLYEIGKFAAEGRRSAITDLIQRYNEIIESVETDPSLKIEYKK